MLLSTEDSYVQDKGEVGDPGRPRAAQGSRYADLDTRGT